MLKKIPKNLLLVVISLFVAFILNTIEYPSWMLYAKPNWLLLVLFYWSVVTPNHISVGWGWSVGLVADVMFYTLLGQNALTMMVVVFLGNIGSKEIKRATWWQQCIIVLIVASTDIAITASINAVMYDANISIILWQSAIVTSFVWPFVYITLGRVARNVNTI